MTESMSGLPGTEVRPTVGGCEWLALPEFGIACIQAKLDPTRRGSALQAIDLRTVEVEGRTWMRFRLRPIRNDDRTILEAEAPLAACGETTVPVVRTLVTLGETTWPVDLLLIPEDIGGFRMRLGSRALRHRFVVEPDRRYVAGPPAIGASSRSEGTLATDPGLPPGGLPADVTGRGLRCPHG